MVSVARQGARPLKPSALCRHPSPPLAKCRGTGRQARPFLLFGLGVAIRIVPARPRIGKPNKTVDSSGRFSRSVTGDYLSAAARVLLAPRVGDHEEPWFVVRRSRCRLCYRCRLDRLYGVAAFWVDCAGCRAIQSTKRAIQSTKRAIQFTKGEIQFTKSSAGACGGSRSELSRKRQPCAHVPPCERISRQARPQTRPIG